MENIHENGTFQLHNKVEIPQVGFGTWQMPDGETAADAVMHAIEAGYTHIDTAAVYHNEIGWEPESACRECREKSCL